VSPSRSRQIKMPKTNYYDTLCNDLKFYIATFVSSKPDLEIPYIQEYKDVVVDWYNKYMVYDNSVYRNYTELYKHGILSQKIPYMKYAFFNYKKEKKYYRLFLSHYTGQFEKKAIYNERCINIYKNRMKINPTKKARNTNK